MLCALAAFALTLAPPLVTAEGEPVGLDVSRVEASPPSSFPVIGVQVDVGAPDGIGISLVVTPGRFLRLSIGGLSNGVGAGVRLGAMLVAFPSSAFRPLLGIDGGYVIGGQAAWLPRLIQDEQVRSAISGLNVGFVNAQVGFELGSKNVALTLRGGVSYVDVAAANQTFLTGGGSTLSAQQITLRGFLPSARLGFLFCFG